MILSTKTARSALAYGRLFMTGKGDNLECGAEICASCGQDRAVDKISRAFNSTFNQTDFFLFDSPYICTACKTLFADKDVRSKCLLWLEAGVKQVISREEVLPFLRKPSWPFVLSLPYSFQKHHIFYAGLSDAKKAVIGTDGGPVFLDYATCDITAIDSLIHEMLVSGVPRKELERGVYGIYTRQKFGSQIDRWEASLAPLRPDGAIELLVRYQPATKEKVKTAIEEGDVYTDTEKQAIALLASLAYASRYRREHGMDFWATYFRRRVVRYSGKDVNAFYSAMAQAIACDPTQMDLEPLHALTDAEMGCAVMKEIAEKADLLIAAAYTIHKERLEGVNVPTIDKKKKATPDAYTLL